MKDLRSMRLRMPLVLQILALLFAGLVIAQIVTLLLSTILPRAPIKRYDIAAIAAAIQNSNNSSPSLQRVIQRGPPDITGTGWIASYSAQKDLAARLGVPVDSVSVAYYTPLPFAGTAYRQHYEQRNGSGSHIGFSLIASARAQSPAPPPPPPQGAGSMPGGNLPPQTNGEPQPRQKPPPEKNRHAGGAGRSENGGLFDVAGSQDREQPISIPGDGRAAVPPIFGPRSGPSGPPPKPISRDVLTDDAPPNALIETAPKRPDIMSVENNISREKPSATLPQSSRPSVQSGAESPQQTLPPTVDERRSYTRNSLTQENQPRIFPERPIAIAARQSGLFDLSEATFVEGDFVAAWRRAPGRWIVVQPAPETFPNSWQRRVLLWFTLSFMLVLPFGWLFARRIVKPLGAFAFAAEQLGRDPSGIVVDIDGPAEVGRAAHAFNVMQNRLKSFVDDRTAMVGAISHDLRTPLTRLRFRIEEVDDDSARDGMVQEVGEMEEMINSVLTFIRDASTPGVRDRVDLQTILSDVVSSAVRTGSAVALEIKQPAPVEVDPLGMRRLLGNLIDNALKYGGAARVRLHVVGDQVVTDIVDNGPGIPEGEIERAFEPFYRSADARSSAKQGSGLGLAVCRSIARAHGGDVSLLHQRDGFTARFQIPLAYAA